ncbi:hypothetical protein SGQ44_16245 [Flavobacterium sp. Fl-77]|uniref:Uncharacterized protein n=1 Tax=Flavobacterium flavipigmentatum TaxID=2893884 RepID=A0AAJ2VXW3_9FLAO|nr:MULTISPECIES: hypothetical protein [unclassified Flavobacterium]MDX6183722.1 hypothetical protein [Flavobacterium sp. Fl-33]MDX6187317.1 hypothetical protein [Flavobacterium sp. Fl-77]UFH38132.1 hypothetical protein LNP22_15490 [Flavobacterium sp. F-70]
MKTRALALMGAASPDLEKQGFLAVVFVNREYSGQQEIAPDNDHAQDDNLILSCIKQNYHFF